MMEDEVKYNDATKKRPEGGRILDAPLVHMDLQEYIQKIRSEQSYKDKDLNSMTIYKADGLRVVLIAMHKHAVMEKHVAKGTINVQVLEGHVEFSTAEQTISLKEKEMIALHPNIPHEVKALKESVFLLTLNLQKQQSAPDHIKD